MNIRLVNEFRALTDKIAKLDSFLCKVKEGIIQDVDENQIALMRKQFEVMNHYQDILQERIVLLMESK